VIKRLIHYINYKPDLVGFYNYSNRNNPNTLLKIFNYALEVIMTQAQPILTEINTQIANDADYEEGYILIISYSEDCIRMAYDMSTAHYENIKKSLYHAKSLSQIKLIHDRLINLFNHQHSQNPQTNDIFTNKPPVSGTEFIKPIISKRDLYYEGEKMHHCVGSYIDNIEQGKCWIYRVLQPERATLQIMPKYGLSTNLHKSVHNKNKQKVFASQYYSIGQLYKACNNPVNKDTLQVVQRWLNITEFKPQLKAS